ncbi:MAG: restriction endonuclease [Candidatus Aenigmarchaeota archaeon]|nr:restriction endonuclease [Candidatus Aenigmarchaeota archaeon]
MLFVTKADGRKQPFSKRKIVRTCVRMGVSKSIAKQIANEIEARAYDGIPTKKILNMIFQLVKQHKPHFKYRIDLRTAISLLRPKPDFETFVRFLLKNHGYDVLPNQILNGKCVDHELDGILKKDKQTFMLEVKHHKNPHVYTGVDVCLISYATFLDLNDGYKAGTNTIKLDGVVIVCNTKFSDHAKRYARCKGIELIGWNYPTEINLERMVEDRKLYPITILKSMDPNSEQKFGDSNIVLLKQLVEISKEDLWKMTRVPKDKLERFVKEAKEILGVA